MSEQTFANTPAEPTEMERIQQRIQNHRIQITPSVAQAVQALLVSYLKSDQVTIDDLEVMISVRNEIKKGLDEYKTTIESAQRRLNELHEQEVQKKQIEIAERAQLEKTKLNEEKVRRKHLEDRIKKLEEEHAYLDKKVTQLTKDRRKDRSMESKEVLTRLKRTKLMIKDAIARAKSTLTNS